MTSRFELNGTNYATDKQTISVLRSIMPSAKATGDSTAVMAVIFLGLQVGRIVEAGR
jgi:hypothetical protein